MPGVYEIELALGEDLVNFWEDYPFNAERFWWPGTHDRSETPWIEVGVDTVVVLAENLSSEAARLEGRISGAWLELGLSSEPDLRFVGLDSTIIRGFIPVDEEGRFACNLQFPVPVKVRVEQNGIEQWIGGPGFAEASVFNAQPGETISDIDLVQCGLQIRIDSDETYIGWPYFNLYDPVDYSLLATAGSAAYNDRNIGIGNLWPGEYLMEISPGTSARGSLPWRPQWFDRAACAEDAQPIVLGSAGDVVTLEVVLERGGVIGGRIVSSSGSMPYHYVFLIPADENLAWARYWHWCEDHDFQFSGVPEGAFKIGFLPTSVAWDMQLPPPADTIWYPGTQNWDAATILSIENANEINDIVFEVP